MQTRFVNIKQFDIQESSKIKELSEEYSEKFERHLPNSKLSLDLHKQKEKEKSDKVKYAIHARLITENTTLISKASDWDLARTLHKVFKGMENEIQHKYRTEGQPQEKLPRKR